MPRDPLISELKKTRSTGADTSRAARSPFRAHRRLLPAPVLSRPPHLATPANHFGLRNSPEKALQRPWGYGAAGPPPPRPELSPTPREAHEPARRAPGQLPHFMRETTLSASMKAGKGKFEPQSQSLRGMRSR